VLEWLIHIDKQLFFQINHCLSNDIFDMFMPLFRNKLTWIPLYGLILFLWIKKYSLHAVWVILFAVATLLIADQLSAHLIKPLVGRLRPCNDPNLKNYVHALVDCGSGFSFVSSHATNHFALAIFFIMSLARPSNRPYVILCFLLWASLISFAQVYVGVHFPLDVLVGGFLGMGIGALSGWGLRYLLCIRSGKVL
jgi:membrane-associated phospholipid phosphatase